MCTVTVRSGGHDVTVGTGVGVLVGVLVGDLVGVLVGALDGALVGGSVWPGPSKENSAPAAG